MWGRKTVNKLKTTPPLYSIHVSCLCNSIYFQRYWITTVKTSQELPMLSSVKKWPVSQSVIDIGHLQSCQTLLWRAENQEKKAHKLGRCYLHWLQNWLLTTLVILQLQTGSLKSECWEGPQSGALRRGAYRDFHTHTHTIPDNNNGQQWITMGNNGQQWTIIDNNG